MTKSSYATVGFGDRDVEAALDAIAAAGFDQAEILGQEPHIATPLRGLALLDFAERLESRGLSSTVHAPLSSVLGVPDEQWRRQNIMVLIDYLHFSAAIGSKEMVVHPVPHPTLLPDPQRSELPGLMKDAARRSLDELVPVAGQVHIRILLENLPRRPSCPLACMRQLRILVDSYPPDCAGLVIDTGHASASGKDPVEEIHIAGHRLHGTHLQDVDLQVPNDEHWIPTHGGLDWDAIKHALANIDYSGAWTFEVINGRNGETPDELARLSRQIARDWGL